MNSSESQASLLASIILLSFALLILLILFIFLLLAYVCFFFFCQAEDGIRDHCVTGVQTCALPISRRRQPRTPLCEPHPAASPPRAGRSEEHTSELRHTVTSYAVSCLKKKKTD